MTNLNTISRIVNLCVRTENRNLEITRNEAKNPRKTLAVFGNQNQL